MSGLRAGLAKVRRRASAAPSPFDGAAIVFLAATGFVLLVGLYLLLRWPIALGDADIWYHLHAGRFIWSHGRLPVDTSHFSFIDPPRRGADYSWLFQTLLYGLFAVAGYYGLIAAKALIFAATLVLLAAYLWRAGLRGLPGALLCALLSAALMDHFKLARPQTLTVFFIAWTLVVLEWNRRSYWTLPLIALLWANFHGIFYPVLLAMLAAYAIDLALGPRDERSKASLAWLMSAMACAVLTPSGAALLPLPFLPMPVASQKIAEFAPLSFPALWPGGLYPLVSYHTALAVLFWLSTAAFAVAIAGRPKAPTRHLLLSLCGFALLWRGQRFLNYAALLSLPLVAGVIVARIKLLPRRLVSGAWLRAAGAGVFFGLLFFPASTFRKRPRYPVSEERLPRGIAAFLNAAGTGGRVLNHPNAGGFLEWSLAPSYRIYMDMRIPHLFTDEDFATIREALLLPGKLQELVARYHPSYISVPLRDSAFTGLVSPLTDYVPVFFDDAEALYVDRRNEPKLAARFELKTLRPFELAQAGYGILGAVEHRFPQTFNPESVAAEAKELDRLLAVDPHCMTTRELAAELALRRGDKQAALLHARAIVADFPEYPVGYALLRRIESY